MSRPIACPQCLRRANLIAALSPHLQVAVGAGPGHSHAIAELLALPDEQLANRVAPREAAAVLAQVNAPTDQYLQAEAKASTCWSVCRHQERFPTALREADVPAALFGRGDPAHLVLLRPQRTVAIVGARRASAYGREVARELGRELAAEGLVVLSGLAFGIDACAHRGALDAGLTVAVLGCGADVAYPAAHRSLWRRIRERGLVLSELPPGAGPWRWTFPARNRIVAALAAMTIVVEAAEHSGSMITARFAAQFGKTVGAVPGPITSRASGGPNGLLAGGAVLVRHARDVIEAMRDPELKADPDLLRRSAATLIAEDRVPSEVLAELIGTYQQDEEESPCD